MEKKKKLMVCILTSGKLEYFRESYNSVINQQSPQNLDWDLFIIVNTLNNDYYNTILNEYPNSNVIRTKSNGKSGKGHNSVLDFFESKSEYDNLLMLDGDDFLYPSAIRHIEAFITQNNPEILMLMGHDVLDDKIPSKNFIHMLISNKLFLRFNIPETKGNQWLKEKSLNPFKNPIYKLNTMGRLVLFSRESCKYKIRYDENCNLYDDFYPSMQFLELAYKKKNVLRTDDSNIYLYNTINSDSQTKKFFSDKKKIDEEEKIFRKSIKKNKNLNIIKDWDLSKIEMKSIDYDPLFLFRDKYMFTTNLVANLDIDKYLHEDICVYKELLNYIVQNKLQDNYQFLIDYYSEKSKKLIEFLNN